MTKAERQKLISEWFERGYQAGKRDNPSGCVCEFDADGDQVLSYCAVHAAELYRLKAGLRLALAQWLNVPWDEVRDEDVMGYVRGAEELGVE